MLQARHEGYWYNSCECHGIPDSPRTVSCAVRTAKFVARKQWVVAGADDMFIRVYNHNTMEKIKSFEAHTDYIRCMGLFMLRRALVREAAAKYCRGAFGSQHN